MFCRFMPLLLAKKDITKLSSDGNPGSANVFINCGIPLGLLCLFLDMFKGFLPVLLAEENYDVRRLSFAILIAAPVLGHAVAPFDRSKGGKCIATAFGVLLALVPQTKIVFLLAGLYILFSTAIRISPNRVQLVHELYSGYEIQHLDVRRMINSNASRRKGREVLITNY